MKKGILQRLSDGPVLGDGGYIVELEQRGYVVAGAFAPERALEHPDAIREMHREFLHAGAEVLQVMAFHFRLSRLSVTLSDADNKLRIIGTAPAQGGGGSQFLGGPIDGD